MPKGEIITRYAVRCGKCQYEQDLGSIGVSKIGATARAIGFTKTHSLGWLCAVCSGHVATARDVAATRQFYVYTLAYPDGKVFYIGKGQGARVSNHEREATTKCRCFKCRTIRKIWREGQEIVKAIVFETEIEDEAYAREVTLIAHYGRDNLCNCTDGGRGIGPYELRAMKREHHLDNGLVWQSMDGRWFASINLITPISGRNRKTLSGKTPEAAIENIKKWSEKNKDKIA